MEMKELKEIRILNQTASVPGNPKVSKFWNFINKDDETAELQLFGEIVSEEGWWDEDCVTYRNFINDLNGLGDKKNINVIIHSIGLQKQKDCKKRDAHGS